MKIAPASDHWTS